MLERVLITILLSLACATHSKAQIFIEFAPPNSDAFNLVRTIDTVNLPQNTDFTVGPVDITINNANSGIFRIYSPDYNNVRLGRITFTNSNANVRLLIGQGIARWNSNADPSFPGFRSWNGGPTGGVQQLGCNVFVIAHIRDDINGLTVSRITRLKAGGKLFGVYSHQDDGFLNLTDVPKDMVRIQAALGIGSAGSPASFFLSSGSLQRMDVTNGDVYANFTCFQSASLQNIFALNSSFFWKYGNRHRRSINSLSS